MIFLMFGSAYATCISEWMVRALTALEFSRLHITYHSLKKLQFKHLTLMVNNEASESLLTTEIILFQQTQLEIWCRSWNFVDHS